MAASHGGQALQPTMSSQSLDCGPNSPRSPPIDNGDNIRVYVRMRPPLEREEAVGTQSIVTIDRPTRSVLTRGDQPRTFTFDGVLGEDSSQDEAFDLVGRSIGSSCLAGYNGSVYVYGQTGVGKTYTMVGPVSSVQSMQFDERRGLICRILDYVFAEIHRRRAQSDGGVSYLCRCSFLEIYKEQITDLLEPGNTSLQVREDMNRGVYVERLSEPTVWTLTEAFQALWKGLQHRHVGATHMNERSSRSHSVFTLSVEVAQTRSGVTSTRVARLSLVDLAGSERQQGVLDASNGLMTPHQSLRVKEAGAINKSLSALTNVIMSLSREERTRRRSTGTTDPNGGRRPFVHYRDSKLTFLLRDSLGGNSKTVIVANISPSGLCFAETLSTLKFAARAKHIRCAAVRNEEFSGTVESLMQEVKALRQQLSNLSSGAIRPRLSLASLAESTAPPGARKSCGGDEEEDTAEEVLYSRKRVRRLEVLLAAALERERQADRRRHQLQKLAQFLEDLDFRKSVYLRKLHKDFSGQIVQLDNLGYSDSDEVIEMAAKLKSFGNLLGVLSAAAQSKPGQNSAACADNASAPHGGASPEAATAVAGNLVSNGGGTPGRGAAPARPHAARNRGTSQSGQSRGLLTERIAAATSAISNSHGFGIAATAGGALHDGSAVATSGHGQNVRDSDGDGAEGVQNNLMPDEAAFLLDENRRLREQLEFHPEVQRLAAENRSLRSRLASLDSGGGFRDRFSVNAGASQSQSTGHGSLRRDRSLTRTLRSTVIDTAAKSTGMVGAIVRTPSNSSEGSSSFGCGSPERHGGCSGFEGDVRDGAGGCDDMHALSARPLPPPVTAEMLLRSADTDEDNTLKTWVYFQKMAKEVEELLRARENLANKLTQVRSRSGSSETPGGGVADARGVGLGGASPVWSSLPCSTIDPSILEDVVQSTQDALQLGQAIIDSSRSLAQESVTAELIAESRGQAADNVHDAFGGGSDGATGPTNTCLQRNRHTSSSSNFSSADAQSGSRGGLLGFLSQSKSFRGLVPVNEQDSSLSRSPPPNQHKASDAQSSPISQTRSIENRTASPRHEGINDKPPLRQALQRVKHMHGTLDLVNAAYSDAYDQFQHLREEYESRIEECQFYELQCSRLDIHCHELTERLHGSGASVRPGIGSFSATGFSPQSKLSSPGLGQGIRSFSLSSLRDVNFWEQRFQELSQLTGIEEADPGQNGGGANGQTQTLGQPQHYSHFPYSREALANVGVVGGVCNSTGVVGPSAAVTARASPMWQQPTGPLSPSSQQAVAETRPHIVPEPQSVRPHGTPGNPMKNSMSLSTLHSQKPGPHQASSAEQAPMSLPWPGMRKVASAPLLPTFVDIRGASRHNVSGHSLAVGTVMHSSANIPARADTAAAGGVNNENQPNPGFDAATFLSLARQPGDKSVAMQYVRQSTTNALAHPGASTASAQPTAKPVAATNPAFTSPTISSQGASGSNDVGGNLGVGGGSACIAGAQPQSQHDVSAPRQNLVASRSRAAQPPPLSLSLRSGNRTVDSETTIPTGIFSARAGGVAGSSPRIGPAIGQQSAVTKQSSVVTSGSVPTVTGQSQAGGVHATSVGGVGGARPLSSRPTALQQRPSSRGVQRNRAGSGVSPSTGTSGTATRGPHAASSPQPRPHGM
eukprot:TRINITY_DN11549_c0_g1_i4.p1 TRINITY_DN11549_c0_g1~~TRINITY_DN11549_c0_g1_i4.p1  ORF type:complete len:1656 (+),score=250.53 TRINITY_DN11549_c0_g1_i4:54-5021(+)